MRGEEQARAHYAEGLRLQKNGALRDALMALSRATAADPGFAPAAFELGRTHALLGQPVEAIAAFESALKADPTLTGAAFHLGRARESVGQTSGAIDAYQRTMELDPDNFASAVALGRLLVESGRALEALSVWAAAGARWPEEKAVVEGRAATALALGRPHEAWALLGGGPLDGVPGRALRVLAGVQTALGHHADAIATWDALIAESPAPAHWVGRDAAEAAAAAAAQTPPPDDQAVAVGSRAAAEIAWGRARAFAGDARWADVVAACDAALAHESGWREVTLLRAQALERSGRPEAALDAWTAITTALPDRHDGWVARGRLCLELGRPFDALEAFARVSSDGADSFEAWVGTADAMAATGHAPDAVSWYERALARNQTSVPALRGYAKALTQLGRWREARAAWLRLLASSPGDEEAPIAIESCQVAAAQGDLTTDSDVLTPEAAALLNRGRAALSAGHTAEARAAFEAALVEAPGFATLHFELGETAFADGDLKGALAAYDAALTFGPGHADAARRKGDALRAAEQPLLALVAYDAALAIRAEDADARFGRAETWSRIGRLEMALVDYAAALAIRPHFTNAMVGTARALQSLGRYTEAAGAWERVLTFTPGHGEARAGVAANKRRAEPAAAAASRGAEDPKLRARDEVDRGRSFYRDRDVPSAIASFEAALLIDGANAEAAFRLGLAFEDDRQYRKAIEAYDRCLSIDPNHAHAATNIGEAHRKNERYREAIKAYDRALTISRNWLYALAGRAESMRMLGDYEASLKWFDRALDVGPNHVFAIQGKAASLNALRRFRDALPLWERALAIDTRSQFALDGKAFAEGQLKSEDEGDESEQPPSATPTLDEQGRDLTALARSGRLNQVVGRETEIRALMRTLVRRQKANPILLGEPGVGKTAVVEGLAARLAKGDAPARLDGLRIIELSMGSLLAGTKYRGTFEERMKGIVKEAVAHPNIVLFIDEIHTLVGAGRTEGGSLDAANLLKPALARGEIRVIGATTQAEFRKHFESDAALERRFQPIQVEEPTAGQARALLGEVTGQYAEHHDVDVAPDTVAACVDLSVRYLPDRRLPDKALDLLDEACADASLSGAGKVDAETVARVVSERTGIAVGTLTEDERGRLSRLDQVLAERVVAQDDAVRTLVAAVRRARTGLTDPKRPRGVFLFVGGSGVGKTELARTLAETLFPDSPALIRIDMSEFGDRFTGTRLVGAPPGYVGHGEEGQLTGKLRRRPYAVVLLDEIEKAHADVQAMFLTLFDEGTIEDSDGRRVQAREAIFVATTNAGTEIGARGRAGFSPGSAQEVKMERLKPYFRPELLNRFDAVVFFEALDAPALQQIATTHLERLRQRVVAQGMHLRWTDAVVQKLASHHADPKHGARPVLRAIRTLVEEPLGDLVLAHGARPAASWFVDVVGGELRFEQEAHPQDPQPTAPQEPAP